MTWTKTGKRVGPEGTTITYSLSETDITIESRKRHIPHANREGTWDHTSYFVLHGGYECAEKHSLAEAKEFAVKRSRKLDEMPFDHEFGGELCHATGYEVFLHGEWWNEYEDSEGELHYGR